MAPKISPLVGLCFLLLALSLNTTQSKSSGFDFLKHLEGCHKGQSVKGLHNLKKYLEKFGYLNYKEQGKNNVADHSTDDEFDDLLESAVKEYQHFYHLNVSGSLDSNTLAQMAKPRCGVPDVVHGKNSTTNNHHHHQHIHGVEHYRFFPRNLRWPPTKTHLTYKFRSTGQAPTMDTIRSVTVQAFQRWAQVTHFTFQEVSGNSAADIDIGFHRRNHGDGPQNAFDGPLGTFAHATAPAQRNNFCHFDAEERWSTNPAANQVDFESVAVHEIGHLLGLDHSEDQNAIMYAYFDTGITKRDLRQDDINGIRALYR